MVSLCFYPIFNDLQYPFP